MPLLHFSITNLHILLSVSWKRMLWGLRKAFLLQFTFFSVLSGSFQTLHYITPYILAAWQLFNTPLHWPSVSVNFPIFWSTLLRTITAPLHFSSASLLWLTNDRSHSGFTKKWHHLLLRSSSIMVNTVFQNLMSRLRVSRHQIQKQFWLNHFWIEKLNFSVFCWMWGPDRKSEWLYFSVKV